MSDRPPPETVHRSLTLDRIDADPDVSTLKVDLSYKPTEPFAVTADFHTSAGAVTWIFARDLLVEGSYEPVGDGDVRIWPCLGPDARAVVVIELLTGAPVLMAASARDIAAFVNAMLVCVPLGDEVMHLDLDHALGNLLAG